MPVTAMPRLTARAAAFALAEFVALVRVGPMLVRAVLLAAPFVPVLVHGPTGAEDGAFGALTATFVPALAFAWGLAWSRQTEPRLRALRPAFLGSPRLAKGALATFTALAGALAFAASCAVVAARAHAPLADTLALARIGFASAFAWIGLGAALAPGASAFTALLPLALATMRSERGVLYALVPNAQAYALTVDPVSGLEARARFGSMLAVGLTGLAAFALRTSQSSQASQPSPSSTPR